MKITHQIKVSMLVVLMANTVHAYEVEKVSSGLIIPWGLAYIDDNTMLITERNGAIKRLNLLTGEHKTLAEIPNVWAKGQGGLLDIALSPFDDNKIYVTYSKENNNKGILTLASATYRNGLLSDWKDIFVSISQTDTNRHFGSRITFDNNSLYLSIGDRGERENGQNTLNHAGSILRLYPDGSTPPDNPFVSNENALDEIWSYGHRNPQGLFFDHKTEQLWSIEHGPRGGDEINLIKEGANYGWPITSHGKEYWGPMNVGEATEKEDIESPIKVYIPSIAPSSLVLYRGDTFPELKGKLLSGALKLTHINVVTLNKDGDDIAEDRILLNLGERIRDIEVSPNGEIFFSTDSGHIYKLKR
ncbi:PQQ-dependent sugar dehydrogenase [Vibrio sp. DW001]|uniref:PQQ-dependent sugar dehydrogenase n=1 Tax=Vibrio sp. DW001 TaxID=2912315 RepID=UPI0023B141E1|nr:PQQ-dependent sugar dehydrogenase [Vibrio sp. DW001]WED28257.1 PQQ-dependent sugar dehydrogenase [Vibrio sp. DW001]